MHCKWFWKNVDVIQSKMRVTHFIYMYSIYVNVYMSLCSCLALCKFEQTSMWHIRVCAAEDEERTALWDWRDFLFLNELWDLWAGPRRNVRLVFLLLCYMDMMIRKSIFKNIVYVQIHADVVLYLHCPSHLPLQPEGEKPTLVYATTNTENIKYKYTQTKNN